ncbi:MAG: dTMP kinase [Defluviicoccus sp.]|nr:dTMP kinase [Defluviicoccus sp.]MDE0382645.1 dTMP kinase [Defluviicoccus sp.]
MTRGRFITVEGGEGAGKSTQAARLAETLERRGIATLVTREPGGTRRAERLRELLLDPEETGWEPETEVLLYFAGRVENVAKTIEPALAAGRTVICDRFADSTLAYQGYGSLASLETIRSIGEAALRGFRPDLTLILDIDPKMGLARTRSRSAFQDRYERELFDYHRRVRQGFLAIAEDDPDRCAVVDAAASVGAVAEAVLARVEARFEEFKAGKERR